MTQTKLILALILTVLLTVGVVIGGTQVLAWRKAYFENQQKQATMEATDGILSDASQNQADRDQADQRISTGRENFNNDVEEAKRHDQNVRDRADRPVPDSVLRAFRERRLARERLGRAGAGGSGGREAKAPPER